MKRPPKKRDPTKRAHVRKADQQEPRPVTAQITGRPINAPRGLGYETDGTYIRRRGRS